MAAEQLLLDTVLRVSQTGLILYRPLRDTAGHIVDFAFVHLNPAAQRRLGLPECPSRTYLQQYPHAASAGVLDFYRDAFACGEVRHFDLDYPHEELHAYFRLTAQRHEDLLVVSFTDAPHRDAAPAEAVLHAGRRQAQAARAAAEAQYAALERVLDQAPALLCILRGPDLVVDFANAAYQQLLGGRPLQGQRLAEALPGLAEEGIQDLLLRVYHTGELYQAADFPVTLDFAGTGRADTRYFTFSYQAKRDATGRVDGVIVVGYDATEQVRARQQVLALNQHLTQVNQELEARVAARTHTLQEREQYFRQLADLVPTLIRETDAQGACVYLNASWYAYTGQDAAAGLGDGWFRAVHPDDAAAFAAIRQAAWAQHRPFTARYRLRRPDGRYCWVQDSGRPRFGANGALAGYLAAVTDIDEQQQAQYAQQQLTAELRAARDQAQVLNAELAARNEQLLRLNADLDTFVYLASHDLRAPVFNIEGLVQALQEDLGDLPVPPTAAHVLRLLSDSTERFKETIEQLLVVARAQQEPAPVARLALEPVLHAVLADLRPLVEQTAARVEVAPAGCYTVALPAHHARSIVYNLLSNALKYRHPDRAPHVRVSCHHDGGHTVLTVQDNGLGLDAAQRADLFGPFRRLHPHPESIGIGLYVVKRIVENAGGGIEVESEAGVGTTFRVRLPR